MLKFAFAAVAAVTLATTAFAESQGSAAAIDMNTQLGTTKEEVTATLTEMGYEVRKFEMEDDKMEVYFVGNGKMGEVYVSQETGKPTKIEME